MIDLALASPSQTPPLPLMQDVFCLAWDPDSNPTLPVARDLAPF